MGKLSKNFRTNKKRNSGLVYEMLVYHISRCLVEGKKVDAQKTVAISKKYFAEGCPLRQELDLFSAVLKTNVKSRDSAQKIIDSICNTSSTMNSRALDEQKSRLIKDINYTFNQESFYDYKIPNYTIYASVQTLLNEARNKKKSLSVADRVKIEESVCDYLTKENKPKDDPLKINPNYSNAVYNFLMKRFHNKYEGKLNESQKRLLTKYAVYLISNRQDPLKEFILKEVDRIKNSLLIIRDESINKDSDLMNKISECRKKFYSFSLENITEQKILEVLQYMRLIEELDS
ncbi:MAG: hypothetical protein UT24_C0036G0003 [Candidatus Woesebacteria bacterium GW2011_GWB1_39_12]|uniref:Uncharacterized protein n=1 Tax=Candidatus Woesebacteria bacterium GW2011_GWB1_39_12 TaxID=1618574 RepID=A0A0G0MEP2_9BACT|nr:MAG: hypothetical protein UT24_C0036G0003 [Candidatus Woesebacteria bacterium GW2011_GWB1_39_12]